VIKAANLLDDALQARFGPNVSDVEIPEDTVGGASDTSAGVVHYDPVPGPRYLGIQRVDTDDFLEVMSSEELKFWNTQPALPLYSLAMPPKTLLVVSMYTAIKHHSV